MCLVFHRRQHVLAQTDADLATADLALPHLQLVGEVFHVGQRLEGDLLALQIRAEFRLVVVHDVERQEQAEMVDLAQSPLQGFLNL